MVDVILSIVGSSTIAGIVTFILTKRKYNTEVDSQQIQNMKESFEVYKRMMEEALEAQKKRLEDIIASQNKRIEELQEENSDLRKSVSALQNQLINFFGARFKESSTEIQ